MLLEIVLAFVALLAYLYWRWHQKSTYWTRLGVKQPPRNPFLMGNDAQLVAAMGLGGKNGNQAMLEQYTQFKGEKYYGTYGGGLAPLPVLTINDPDILKHILVTDFDAFVDRAFGGFEEVGKSWTDELWNKQMVNARGQLWRDVRLTFSPVFTSGKMRLMLQFMNQTSEDMAKVFTKAAESSEDLDAHKWSKSFSLDVISSCAFGVNAGSFSGEGDTQFLATVQDIFNLDTYEAILSVLYLIPPVKFALDKLKVPLLKPKSTKFFHSLITQTLRHRMATGEKRNDMIDLMIAATRKELDEDNQEDNDGGACTTTNKPKKTEKKAKLDEFLIVATAMALLVAGYDTSGNTLGLALWLLATYPAVQDRLQAEIDGAHAAGETDENGRLTYNALMGMEYLDMAVQEVTRLFPIAGSFISREANREYRLPGTDLTLPKGAEVHVPAIGIHMDERHYPDPERFEPERFSKEAKAARHPMTYLTFGQGPRACVGSRFALLEIKMGLAKLLREFDITSCERTPAKIEMDPSSATLSPKHPLWVRVKKRDV